MFGEPGLVYSYRFILGQYNPIQSVCFTLTLHLDFQTDFLRPPCELDQALASKSAMEMGQSGVFQNKPL